MRAWKRSNHFDGKATNILYTILVDNLTLWDMNETLLLRRGSEGGKSRLLDHIFFVKNSLFTRTEIKESNQKYVQQTKERKKQAKLAT